MFEQRILLLIIFMLFGCLHYGRGQDEYEQWQKKDQQEFLQFISEEDKAFLDFLKREWPAFQTQPAVRQFSKPKPVTGPQLVKDTPKPKASSAPIITLPVLPESSSAEKVVSTSEAKPVKVNFYGIDLGFSNIPSLKLQISGNLTNRSISQLWEVMAKSDYKAVLSELKDYRKKYHLNDWGFVQLVYQLSTRFTGAANEQIALTWFLLNKSGLNANVAYKSSELFLLMPSNDVIYEQPFVLINGERYYFISLEGKMDFSGKIHTYAGKHPAAREKLNLKIQNLPALPEQIRERTLSFDYEGKTYSISLQYDARVVQFFKNYPQTKLKLYFDAPVSQKLLYSLVEQLRPIIQGRNEVDAVNLLLRFVQTAFSYKTDEQQFGHEKYMLPDEVVYYSTCDCEDRSILFAFLVRRLLQLDVIGLDYPNHVATAVAFRAEVEGQRLHYNGKKYLICDPTYVNAPIGMVVPEVKDLQPEIIPL